MQEPGQQTAAVSGQREWRAVPALLVFTSVLWTGLTLAFVILARRAEGLREHYMVVALVCGGMLGLGVLGTIVGVMGLLRRRRG